MIRWLGFIILFFLCACAKDLPDPDTILDDQLDPQQVTSQIMDSTAQFYVQPIEPDAQWLESLAIQISSQGSSWTRALQESLAYVQTRPQQDQAFSWLDMDCSWARVTQTLVHLQSIMPQIKDDPLILSRDFFWYKLSSDFLVTGYFEPELEGSLEASPDYPVPIWGLPPSLRSIDLGQFHPQWQGQTLVYQYGKEGIIPFYTRHEIDSQGVLASQQKPLAWAKDEVDLFFLHIQGSGRLRLPDGQSTHILYAGKNGHEYVSLGKTMLNQGLIAPEEMSMPSITQYLRAHPHQIRSLLDTNPSYVFFRLADHGPLGAMGRTLTPMISVATDSKVLPLGTLLALETTLPNPQGGQAQGSTLLTLAQDRGGAIKKARLDLFCGAGPEAEFLAGHLQAQGQVYLLLKK